MGLRTLRCKRSGAKDLQLVSMACGELSSWTEQKRIPHHDLVIITGPLTTIRREQLSFSASNFRPGSGGAEAGLRWLGIVHIRWLIQRKVAIAVEILPGEGNEQGHD